MHVMNTSVPTNKHSEYWNHRLTCSEFFSLDRVQCTCFIAYMCSSNMYAGINLPFFGFPAIQAMSYSKSCLLAM